MVELAGQDWVGRDACQADNDCALVQCVDCCGPLSLNNQYVAEWYEQGQDKKDHGIFWDCVDAAINDSHYEPKCENDSCRVISVANTWQYPVTNFFKGLAANFTLIFTGWIGYFVMAVILVFLAWGYSVYKKTKHDDQS